MVPKVQKIINWHPQGKNFLLLANTEKSEFKELGFYSGGSCFVLPFFFSEEASQQARKVWQKDEIRTSSRGFCSDSPEPPTGWRTHWWNFTERKWKHPLHSNSVSADFSPQSLDGRTFWAETGRSDMPVTCWETRVSGPNGHFDIPDDIAQIEMLICRSRMCTSEIPKGEIPSQNQFHVNRTFENSAWNSWKKRLVWHFHEDSFWHYMYLWKTFPVNSVHMLTFLSLWRRTSLRLWIWPMLKAGVFLGFTTPSSVFSLPRISQIQIFEQGQEGKFILDNLFERKGYCLCCSLSHGIKCALNFSRRPELQRKQTFCFSDSSEHLLPAMFGLVRGIRAIVGKRSLDYIFSCPVVCRCFSCFCPRWWESARVCLTKWPVEQEPGRRQRRRTKPPRTKAEKQPNLCLLPADQNKNLRLLCCELFSMFWRKHPMDWIVGLFLRTSTTSLSGWKGCFSREHFLLPQLKPEYAGFKWINLWKSPDFSVENVGCMLHRPIT